MVSWFEGSFVIGWFGIKVEKPSGRVCAYYPECKVTNDQSLLPFADAVLIEVKKKKRFSFVCFNSRYC
jgi:hypothetical protein